MAASSRRLLASLDEAGLQIAAIVSREAILLAVAHDAARRTMLNKSCGQRRSLRAYVAHAPLDLRSACGPCRRRADRTAHVSGHLSVRYWSKEINGTLPGGRNQYLIIRGDDGAMGHGGRAGLILSIAAREVSLGSLRVGTIHVQEPTPHARRLPSDTNQYRCLAVRRAAP